MASASYTARIRRATLALDFPFDRDMNEEIKNYGAQFHRDTKRWSLANTARNREALKTLGFSILEPGQPKSLDFSFLDDLPLRPYQREGVMRLAQDLELRGLLADEMGLGKTAQAICAIRARGEEALPVLVVCPSSVKGVWMRELARWHGAATAAIINGNARDGATAPRADFVIINYEVLKSWRYLLSLRGFATIVLDECHRIKNPKANWTQAALELAAEARFGICISGTPITSRPMEFFNCLKVAAPWSFPDRFLFGMRYCDPTENRFTRSGWEFEGASHTKELHEISQTFMIRRLKADVLSELPEKVRSVIPVEINLNAYDRDVKKILRGYSGGYGAEALKLIESCKLAAVRAKMKAATGFIKDYLEDHGKLVVFATHRETLDALEKEFPGCVRVDGDTPAGKRQQYVDIFQTDPECRLFIGNLKAAGEGLTLTAASATLTLELAWTPGAHVQAEDRVHRLGQKESVDAFYLVARGSVEEDIMALLDRKMQDINEIMDGRDIDRASLLTSLFTRYGIKKGVSLKKAA